MLEIDVLAGKLKQCGIPFYRFTEQISPYDPSLLLHHIHYPQSGPERVCSCIQGHGAYGYKNAPLEIMGLTKDGYDVEGYLTADEVFERIFKHWQTHKNEIKAKIQIDE